MTPDFPALHSRYSPRVRAVISRILRYRPADVDDAAQETWLRVWRGLASFRSDSAPWTWIYRIAVNCALMVLRGERRTNVKLESLDLVLEVDDGERKSLPHQLTFRDRRLESVPERLELERAVTALTPALRDVYERHYIQGLTYREMFPKRRVSTTRANSFRVRARLRGELTKGAGR